jgi:hypothetical protein
MALPACSSRGRCPFRGPQQRQGRRQLQRPRRATQPLRQPRPSSASCCSRPGQGQGQRRRGKPGWAGGLPAVCMQAWRCCSAEPRLTTIMHLIPGAAAANDVSLCCTACTPCRSPSGRARVSELSVLSRENSSAGEPTAAAGAAAAAAAAERRVHSAGASQGAASDSQLLRQHLLAGQQLQGSAGLASSGSAAGSDGPPEFF